MEDQTLTGLRRISGVVAAYLVDDHGALAGGDDDVSRLQGSLLAAVLGALRQAASDLDVGELGEAILEAERGAVVAGALPGGRAAVVLARDKANLGLIRVELRRLRREA